MCRANSEGGRRCWGHTYGARLNRLKATITQKQEDLERVLAIKMKPAHIQRQIRDLTASLEKKQAHLTLKEAELERVREIVFNPDTHTTVKAVTVEVEQTRTDVKKIETKLDKLKCDGLTDIEKRRKRDLERLLVRKQQKLSALEVEAAEAREQVAREAEERKTAATPPPAPRKHVWDEADAPTLGFSLTPERKEALLKEAGNTPLSEYVLAKSLTQTPVMSDAPAAYLPRKVTSTLHRDGEGKLTVGRYPAEAGRVRTEAVTVRPDIRRRDVLASVNADIAREYGLQPNDYLRRVATGTDLYSVDGWTGKKANEQRLGAIQAAEEADGITADTAEADVAKYRTERFNTVRAEAIEKARQKHGAETVDYVLNAHGGETQKAA